MLWFFLSSFLHAVSWQINPDHSTISFSIPYLEVSQVAGRFNRFQGLVEIDENGAIQKVSVRIEPQSIDTGLAQRDQHLKAQDFLYTTKFPHITFESQEITKSSDDTLIATGLLTIRGLTKRYSFGLKLSHVVTDSWGYPSRFVRLNAKLKRSEFKISWNKTLLNDRLLIGDEVTIWGELQLQRANLTTPPSKHMIPDTPSIRAGERLARGEIDQAQYQKLIGQNGDETIKLLNPPVTVANNRHTLLASRIQVDPRKRLVWQVWFWILGLLGFIASILLGLFGKQWIAQQMDKRYSENGVWGAISDVTSIAITLIYAMAFWNVGWG